MTSEPPSRPRSQPQPPQLIIPGADRPQQRSVSSGPPPIEARSFQPAPSPEPARSPPTQGNKSPSPPPVVASPEQRFPKRSDSLQSRSQDSPLTRGPNRSDSLSSLKEQQPRSDSHSSFKEKQQKSGRSDSLTSVQQRGARSDSLSSVKEHQQRGGRSDSLSRQQQLQQVPKRTDSLTSPLSGSLVSPLSTHPAPPAPVSYVMAGERRGQTAFAPREDDEEEPEPPQPPQPQPVLAPAVARSASDHAPPTIQGSPEPQRSQTDYMGKKMLPGSPPQHIQHASGLTDSEEDDLYSPPAPKIQMQGPSPPRGPRAVQYQQFNHGGPPPQIGQGPQGFGRGSPEPQQRDLRRFSGAGQPGQVSGQMGQLGPQLGPQGQPMGPQGQYMGHPGQQMSPQGYQGQFPPGDPRGQYQYQQQFHQGQPIYQGQPGQQVQQDPNARRTSNSLMKTLSGVSGKRQSIDSNLGPPNSAHSQQSPQYATSTTSSQEKRHSSFFGKVKSKMDDSVKSPQHAQSPNSLEPKMIKEAGRRTSFMKKGKKDKDGSVGSKEKKDKTGKSSHKKGFSMVGFLPLVVV